MTRAEFTVRLAASLRCLNLTHSIHDVMTSLARLEHTRGYATIPSMCLDLACSYQAVMQQLMKNPHLFTRDETHKPTRYTLTPEALELMAKVRARIEAETHSQLLADRPHTTLSSGAPAEPTAPTPAEVQTMRQFLARVVTVPLLSVKVTGNPATDENTDILKSYQFTKDAGEQTTILEKLDALRAIEIDNILAGELDGLPDLTRRASMFSHFVGERANLYP